MAVLVGKKAPDFTASAVINGEEIIDTIEAESGFLEGSPNEPHYVINNGKIPAVSIVTFASVEGMPNLIKVK